MVDFRREKFVNMFGQELNPGDEVIYAGSGYNHSLRFGKGKFAGVFYGGGYWNKANEVSAIKIEGIKGKRWNYKDGQSFYTDIERTAYLPLKRAFRLDTHLSVENLNKVV